MRNPTFATFVELVEEMAQAFFKTVRYGVRAMTRMSWPTLLLSCVVLAMAISIVPLALFLFALFLTLKVIVAAIVLHSRRDKARAHTDGGAQ